MCTRCKGFQALGRFMAFFFLNDYEVRHFDEVSGRHFVWLKRKFSKLQLDPKHAENFS